ncbi:MAG: metallophosphoesterase [Magnetococcales bacterium]|nr:metallophosphoesterase [Magnetococcales bacterium]
MNTIRFLIMTALCAGTALGGIWLLNEIDDLEVTRLAVISGAGPGPGVRIAQLSDLHMTGTRPVETRTLQALSREDPDLLAITGDILPYQQPLTILEKYLRQLPKRARKFAVPGNWDYLEGRTAADMRAFYAALDITLLVNEATLVEQRFLVVGLDDLLFGKPDWDKAIANHRDWHGPVLILAHNPQTVTLLPSANPLWKQTLMLAGHTHGGQVVIFGHSLKPHGFDNSVCYSGWCPDELVRMYVSRGVGSSILPLRIGARPELPIIEWIPS